MLSKDVIKEAVADVLGTADEGPEGAPVGVGPLLEVDTTADFDVTAVVAWVEQQRAGLG